MPDVSGTEQQDATTVSEMLKHLAHGFFLKQKGRCLFLKKKRCDAVNQSRESMRTESQRSTEEPGNKLEAIGYEGFKKILLKTEMPVFIVFYSSKVSLNYHNTSNEQSKRCLDVCKTFEIVIDSFPEKVKFFKFDIEEDDPGFEISHVPTIKLYYSRLGAERKSSVEYFDDPLIVANYERFLKEEGVIGL